MKTLSAADHELIKSRGKVASLTTAVNWSMPDFKQAESRVKRVKKSESNHELIGKMLHTSWGYDMTMNDFCKILEVSPTGKTVKCRMVNTKTNGGEWGFGGTGRAVATEEMVGPYFRLKISKMTDGTYFFNGTYPFCGASEISLNAKKSEYSNRKGYFSISAPGESYYENHMD